jgi:glucose-1-phosphate adenylyltransferase
MESVLAIILAGGRGERLSVLAEERTKPAIPFAGKYRIIDFTINNCINSGVHNIDVLTQYQPLSLVEHIGVGAPWGLATPDRGIRLLQPYLARERGRGWYKGTADAVYQNLEHIDEYDAERVLILSGDHVYKMNYAWMLEFHKEKNADITLAVTRLPEENLEHYGTVIVDVDRQTTGFQEKIKQPKSNLVSMGVYLFEKDILKKCLEEDAQYEMSQHDFGRNVFPEMVNKAKIFAYEFESYWRDVGTIQNYWQTNMDILEMSTTGYLSDAGWPIRTNETERPSAVISENANVVNSLISSGCVIEGNVENSILSPGVIVAEGAIVRDSIIMSDSFVGSHSVVAHSILDKEVVVNAGCYVGFGDDFTPNRRDPEVLSNGITVVGKKAKLTPGMTIGHNCIICPGMSEEDFPTTEVRSGETVRLKKTSPT